MPTTIHERIEGLGFSDASIRAITGLRTLVRHKYAIVDGPREWADSCNPSDDSMERMENMMVPLTSPVIAGRYRRDFDHLWSSGPVEASGNFATAPQVLFYEGFRAPTDVDLSPGPGQAFDELIAKRVARERSRIVICSMLFKSSRLPGVL